MADQAVTDRDRSRYGALLETIKTVVAARLTSNSLEHLLEARLKSLASIEDKLVRKGYRDVSQVTDIAGLRIVIPSSDYFPSVERCLEEEF